MSTVNQVKKQYKALLPSDIGTDLTRDQMLHIEAGLQFCGQFLAHEEASTDLVLSLSDNLPRLVDWRALGGEARLRSVLQLLLKMSNQAWRNALRSYQQLPIAMRCFDIIDEGKQFVALEIGDVTRTEFLSKLFDEIIIADPATINYLPEFDKEGALTNSVLVSYYRNGEQHRQHYRIPRVLFRRAAQAKLPTARARKMPRERRTPITLTQAELVTRGYLLDELDKFAQRAPQALGPRCAQLVLNGVGKPDHQIMLDEHPEHIVGKPSAGKSTLVRSLVPELAARGYRIAVLVNSTAQAQQQAQAFREHGVNATAWCSTRHRREHAMRHYLSQADRIPLRDGFADAGNLAGGCLLRACQAMGEGELSQLSATGLAPPPHASDGICERLFDPHRPNKPPQACPFHRICPSFAQERATLTADVVVITANALNGMRPSPFYYPQCATVFEWINEYIDVVIVDEVDNIQHLLDEAQSLGEQMYSGDAYANIMMEKTSRHSRLKADGGSHAQLEACLNAGTTLERYVRWSVNLIGDVVQRPLGRTVFRYNYNDHSILRNTVRYLTRRNPVWQTAIGDISDILELTTLIEREYERCLAQDMEFAFHQEMPKWLLKEQRRFSRATLAAGWAMARLSHYIQHQLGGLERPEQQAVKYCGQLWYEHSAAGTLQGGMSLFGAWVSAWLHESESRHAEPRHQDQLLAQLSQDTQILLVTAVMTRLAMRTYERLSYPAQQLAAEELALPAAIGQVARLVRLYRTSLPSTLIQNSSEFEYSAPEHNKHRLMFRRLLAPGRCLLYHLPDFRAAEGIAGPHLLMLSGTSYGGRRMRFPSHHPEAERAFEPSLASPDFDVDIPVSVILEQPQAERDAITERSLFEPLVIKKASGQALRVSGSGKHRKDNAVVIAAGLLKPALGGGDSLVEGHFADAQQRWGDEFSGRQRVLLVASSYDMVNFLMQELPAQIPHGRWTLVGVRPDEFKIREPAHTRANSQWLSAADIERFGDFPEFCVLIAPISVISRGHNILCDSPTLHRKVAAISHIYFLNRPHPYPSDQSLIRGLHNRRINALSLSSFQEQAQAGENSVQLLQRLRSEVKTRYQRALHQQLPMAQMSEEARLRALYKPLVQLWQTLCRGVRGGVPVYAGFSDAAFHPQSSKGQTDNTASSLLLGIDQLLDHLLDEEWNPDAELAGRLFDTPRLAFAKIRADLARLSQGMNTDARAEEARDEDTEYADEYEDDGDEYYL